MEEFLASRKLQGEEFLSKKDDPGALTDMPINKFFTPAEVQETTKRAQMFPLSVNDMRRQRLHMLTTMAENLHDSCYEMCTEPNDLTFLSLQEGKCFRNCFTKFNYFQPSMTKNIRDTQCEEQE